MKTHIFKYLNFLVICSLLLLVGCSKDYLETAPVGEVSVKTVFETTENAEMAVNGLADMMTRQYLGSQGFNGEGTIKMYYGNYPGENFVHDLSGWSNTVKGNYHSNRTSIYDYYPWYYYYKIIANANQIIHDIGDAEGPEKDKEAIKAQALSYRAYCYFMLSQLYSVRWVDSDNGATDGLVLRTEPGNDDLPISTLADVYDLVYDDLNTAIDLFKSSGFTRDKMSQNYVIDLNVAYAIYARAAITKQDYENAAHYAELAREGYPLMDDADYEDGFANPTSEWIWSSFDSEDETLYFYSFPAYIAYNSTASAVRTHPKRMSKELYEKIPKTDIRRDLFLDAEGYEVSGTGRAGDDLDALARQRFPDIQDNAIVFDYMNFKFKNNAQPGVGWVNHFRSSEMVLIEAEAKYFIGGKTAEVQSLLEELTQSTGRDPDYTCTKTGQDLLNEIKKYRNIELWGEGFDWFDLKRWKDTIDRKSYSEGGNFITALSGIIMPDEKNNWTWMIPLREADNNKLVD